MPCNGLAVKLLPCGKEQSCNIHALAMCEVSTSREQLEAAELTVHLPIAEAASRLGHVVCVCRRQATAGV